MALQRCCCCVPPRLDPGCRLDPVLSLRLGPVPRVDQLDRTRPRAQRAGLVAAYVDTDAAAAGVVSIPQLFVSLIAEVSKVRGPSAWGENESKESATDQSLYRRAFVVESLYRLTLYPPDHKRYRNNTFSRDSPSQSDDLVARHGVQDSRDWARSPPVFASFPT